MSLASPNFKIGQNVLYSSTKQVGTINEVIRGSREYSYRVTLDGKIRTISEKWLEAIDIAEDRILEDFTKGILGNHKDLNLFQTWFRLSRPLESNLYSYLGSKTIFNPHQFKPLLRFLSSNSDGRLFIADEVGVGKTIESGIIITELLARDVLDYKTPVWIVCPNSLTPKWKKEMNERFNLDFHIHNGDSLKFSLEYFLQNGIFPQRYTFSIVSMQLFRHENYMSILQRIEDIFSLPIFGLIVVDEAHHMRNTPTKSNTLGNILSILTEKMLMLSATPLNLRSEDLFNQMHIINPNVFPDNATFETMQKPTTYLNRIRSLLGYNNFESRTEILKQLKLLEIDPVGSLITSHPKIIELKKVSEIGRNLDPENIVRYDRALVSVSPMYYSFTRTRKREALEHQVHREAWEVPIVLSEDELLFHNYILEVIKEYYLRRGGNPLALGFVTNMYRRMVSSSIPAMREYLEWAIKENQVLMFNQIENFEEVEDDSDIPLGEMDLELREKFLNLLTYSSEIEKIDSKYNQLKNLLVKILKNPETQQVMVFSFFIRTLEYLKRRLENDGFTLGVIHGKIPLLGKANLPGRYNIIDNFKDKEFKILLSSEVGGEGLDFQFCNVIINYDLPYNPMRIEQRIGRIDRFGQNSDKVLIANFFIKNTVDEEIYDRLFRRIRIVEDGIGALEPILGDELSNLQNQLLTGILTDSQKEEISTRIEAAVVSAKIQMEEFERHRREILSDDYLSKPINKLSESTFLTPNDALTLTSQCLDEWSDCAFRGLDEYRAEISLSDNIINQLKSFLQKPGNEAGFSELSPFFSNNKEVKVIFNGSQAIGYPEYIFLAPTGFWSKFLVKHLEFNGGIFKTFGFIISQKDVSLPVGEYLTFIYEVKMEGVKTEIDLLSISIDLNKKEIVEAPPNFLRLLSDIPSKELVNFQTHFDVNIFYDLARDLIAEIINDKHSEAKAENEFKVESRIRALEISSDIRLRDLQQRIQNHYDNRQKERLEPDENFLRLTNGLIAKENERLSTRIERLTKQRNLTLDYSIEGLLYFKVEVD